MPSQNIKIQWLKYKSGSNKKNYSTHSCTQRDRIWDFRVRYWLLASYTRTCQQVRVQVQVPGQVHTSTVSLLRPVEAIFLFGSLLYLGHWVQIFWLGIWLGLQTYKYFHPYVHCFGTYNYFHSYVQCFGLYTRRVKTSSKLDHIVEWKRYLFYMAQIKKHFQNGLGHRPEKNSPTWLGSRNF